MKLLTTVMGNRIFKTGLGKHAGQHSLETTNMTRILSVFNLLKRVGFVFLLLGFCERGYSEWGNELILWSNQEGIESGGGSSDIAIDSQGRAHIAFRALFRYSQDQVLLHRGIYYCCVDTLGNLVVPAMLLTDSGYWDVSAPKILLFEPDSIWVMAKSSDTDHVNAYRYIPLNWNGVSIHPPQVFETCTAVFTTGWDLVSAPDRTVALLAPDGPSPASIKVIVQESDGSRPVDCELAWDDSHCDLPLGYIDHTDSLQLFWRQAPSWNAIYTKRISINDHISPEVIDDYSPLSPEMPGYIHVASNVLALGDSAILIRESHAEDELGDFLRILRRDSYEATAMERISTGYLDPNGVFAVSDTTLGVLISPEYPIYIVQERSLANLSLTSQSDSLLLVADSQTPSGYAASMFGHHHVIISLNSNDGTEGEAQLRYQVWKRSPSTSVRESLQIVESIRIYPNPTNGDVFFRYNRRYRGDIVIFNVLGQVVFSRSLASAGTQPDVVRIPLNHLASGTYILALQEQQTTLVEKFIIQK